MTNLLSFQLPCYFQAVQFVVLLHEHNREHFLWFVINIFTLRAYRSDPEGTIVINRTIIASMRS